MTSPSRTLILAGVLAGLAPAPQAADPVPATTVGTSAVTEASLVSEFSTFLGGSAPAQAVVTGLRQGSAINLTTTTTGTNGQPVTATMTITPPTGTMGYGNVRIALRLAQAELAGLGISQPTPGQLSAALLGGTLNGAPVDGVLALRASGMGWGDIAQQYGTTVGQLMGNGAVKLAPPATVTTGRPAPGLANGYIPSGKGKATGIVTGTGASIDSGKADKAAGKGIVSAGGQPAGAAAGVSNAGGGGKAGAPGQVKKE